MKLRLRRNSIRLRLTQSEVAQLAANGSVEETLEFGDTAVFRYRLTCGETFGSMSASFANDRITVTVPKAIALEWANSGRIGLENTQGPTDPRPLKIRIEKDFACLEPRAGGDDDDTYPNPLVA